MPPPLTHHTSPSFWDRYRRLPAEVQRAADKQFALLQSDPKHPSLRLKKIGDVWSVRAGLRYRALGIDAPAGPNGILWIWIGSHADYDRLLQRR